MRIQHNISALNTYNSLKFNQTKSNSNLEKLSSGFRINRASDDSAGLSISEKMRGQIRGLNMSSKNIQDGISLIQTAEGALNEIHSFLQRGRELSVQSANDTLTNSDRQQIQKEIEQIKDGINKIANDTEFNTKKLLNGEGGTLTTGLINKEVILRTNNDEQIQIYSFFQAPTQNDGLGISSNIAGSGYLRFEFATSSVYDATPLGNNIDESLDNLITKFNNIRNGGASSTPNKMKLINDYNIRMERQGDNILLYSKTNVRYTVAATPSYTMNLIDPNENYTLSIKEKGMVTDASLTLQVGANTSQSMQMELPNVTSKSIGIDTIAISTQNGANDAIRHFDDAITYVSTERSKFGAYQNRLEHAYNSVVNASENLQSSESRIRDADMAKEMMEFTKQNILMRVSQSMLSQAIQQPQGVLQLLQ